MILSGKKCLFIVQGDGRGHMTQAISLKQIIEDAGMQVCEVIIGESKHRHVPQFFKDSMGTVKITVIKSFGLAVDGMQKTVRPFLTFLKNTVLFTKYIKEINTIHLRITETKPDLIINFFEPLCGIYSLLYNPQVPVISVAHHYIFLHRSFQMPSKKYLSNFSLRLYSRLTSLGSNGKLAISLYPMEDDLSRAINVVPPLLRKEVIQHKIESGNHLLVYLLNKGYMDEIIAWHKRNPEVELHCFTDDKSMAPIKKYDDSLSFHYLDNTAFIDLMAHSKGVVTTAGFESVCEAMYLNKPVFMIPVKGHHEQFCNSRDATKAGAGISGETFNISNFLNFIPTYSQNAESFRCWADQAQKQFLLHIENMLIQQTEG